MYMTSYVGANVHTCVYDVYEVRKLARKGNDKDEPGMHTTHFSFFVSRIYPSSRWKDYGNPTKEKKNKEKR